MLDATGCQDYFDEVVRTAEATGLEDKLQDKLDYLEKYGCEDPNGDVYSDRVKCILHKDFAPLSFGFTMQKKVGNAYVHWFVGGLVFHGAHDNYGGGDLKEAHWEVHL